MTDTTRTYYLETYGCQMNVSDSELVRSILNGAGWQETASIDDAQLLLFNTCSVRQHAEQRVLGRISNEKHRKKANPELKIAVLGCMAQRMGKSMLETEPGIDYIIGVDQYSDLPEILAGSGGINTEFDFEQVYPGCQPLHQSRTCAFITIMRGCDNFCSYCIVPHVRGRERSVPFDEIIAEARLCGERGQKEITLLGQNVNSYNYDDRGLQELLRELNKIDSLHRIRFITSHPKDLSDGLIAAMAECDKVCEQIHLPMQSGDSHILNAMNRKYSFEHYLALTEKLRKAMPDIGLTTDVIAGFPGETEAMFANTLAALKTIRFDYAFCFKYSEREGTAATSLAGSVPEAVRLARLQQLIDAQKAITAEKFQAQVGRTVEVYVEDISRKSSAQVSGKTRDFKIAVLSGTAEDIGTLKTAKVLKSTPGTLICE